MELKECPFCGDKPDGIKHVTNESKHGTNSIIYCYNCGLRMFDISDLRVMKAWNTRVEENKNGSK